MTTLPLPPRHSLLLRQRLPGIALCGAITAGALWAETLPVISGLGLGALTLAILCGIITGNTLYPPVRRYCDPGVLFAKQHLLRLGIILYGLRLTFGDIASVGVSGILIDILTLSSTFLLACWLGQTLFGLDRETCWLIGAGSSICGAAAVLATEPVIKAQSSKVTVAVATVVIFGTLAIFIYPLLWPLLSGVFSVKTFGIYTGSTVHEVAQVVAAGHAISPQTENAAVITKMLRVMMLAPFLLLLAARLKHLAPATSGQTARITIPWFAVLFIVVAIVNSFHLLPITLVSGLIKTDSILLAMAMAGLGLTTHASALKNAGLRPLLLALTLFAWLIVGGGLINYTIQHGLQLFS